MSTHFTNALAKSFDASKSDDRINNCEETSRELPIIDSLISRIAQTTIKPDSLELKERISLGGASSMGELQWENEMICADEFNGGEHNGLELEWDDYEQCNIGVEDETEQLIFEIEELTKQKG